jgi:hypothetical protein
MMARRGRGIDAGGSFEGCSAGVGMKIAADSQAEGGQFGQLKNINI